MYKLVTLLLLNRICSGFSYSNRCRSSDLENVRDCTVALGFHQAATHEALTWNSTLMIAYCNSSPNRTSGDHCISQYKMACPMGWGPANAKVFKKRVALLTRTLDKTCAAVHVLQSSSDCIEGQSRQISDCFLEGAEISEREFGVHTKRLRPEQISQIMRKTGEFTQRCIYKALDEECDKSATSLVGNFMYAMFVAIYDVSSLRAVSV